MILRAKVTRVLDDYHCSVRIPQFNKLKTSVGATPDSELYTAVITCNSGVQPIIKSGDTVLVAFDRGEHSAPCIIGLLFNQEARSSKSDASFTSLDVSVNAKFSEDVTIGNVTKDNIKYLEKLKTNVQQEFDDINNELKEKTKTIQKLDARAKTLEKVTEQHQYAIQTNSDNITKLNTGLSVLNTNLSALKTDLSTHTSNSTIHITANERKSWDNKSDKGHIHTIKDIINFEPIILTSVSYGTSDPPATGTEGQLYFKIREEV